jgi:uncharacterized protein YacL
MESWPARALLILASVLLALALRPMGAFGSVGGALLPNALAGALFALAVIAAERITRLRDSAGPAGALAGMIAGGLLASLVGRLVADATPFSLNEARAFATLALGYLGGAIGARAARALASPAPPLPAVRADAEPRGAAPVLLDTSAIIDGRVGDLVATGFVDAAILVPAFVLRELQSIADSADTLRRTRGRRGLEVLERLQASAAARVAFPEDELAEAVAVDDKLVELARRTGARLVTTDFNLSKVAALRGVRVLNVNDLARALRPALLPGDILRVAVVKEGKEPGQGLGYMDDGTMVVIEKGGEALGSEVEVVVTNALQTSAGRMIFAKLAGA